jgi:hypothetical protein
MVTVPEYPLRKAANEPSGEPEEMVKVPFGVSGVRPAALPALQKTWKWMKLRQ